jgi:hypothetical protein
MKDSLGRLQLRFAFFREEAEVAVSARYTQVIEYHVPLVKRVTGIGLASASGEPAFFYPISPLSREHFMRANAVSCARAAGLIALVFVAGCGDGPTAPGIQPQITNLTDAFSYQVSSIQNFTGTFTYTWQNTGMVAKITHASDAGATGTATLIVKDAAGTQVYAGELVSSGQPLTGPAGVAGAWTIKVVYSNYSNTQVNFGASKQ